MYINIVVDNNMPIFRRDMDYSKMKIIIKNIKSQFNPRGITFLFLAPIFLAMFIVVFSTWVYRRIYFHNPVQPFIDIMVSIYLFSMGISGLMVVIKKEFPPMLFISIRGIPAIIIGIIWMLFFWGLVLLMLIINIKIWLGW
jgi:hypothetical protein